MKSLDIISFGMIWCAFVTGQVRERERERDSERGSERERGREREGKNRG